MPARYRSPGHIRAAASPLLVGSADPQRLLVIFSALWVINFDTPPGAKFVLTIYVICLTGAQKWTAKNSSNRSRQSLPLPSSQTARMLRCSIVPPIHNHFWNSRRDRFYVAEFLTSHRDVGPLGRRLTSLRAASGEFVPTSIFRGCISAL